MNQHLTVKHISLTAIEPALFLYQEPSAIHTIHSKSKSRMVLDFVESLQYAFRAN